MMQIKEIKIKNCSIQMNSAEDMVVLSLNKGPWETHTLKNWIETIEENNIQNIFDIGAYTGIYSLIASTKNVKNILAFEPIPNNYNRLIENINLNKSNIKTSSKAISNSTGTAKIQITNNIKLPSGSSISNNPNRKAVATVDIETIKLDDLKETAELIKIDVERHELEVIEGGLTFLKEKKPIIFIELLEANYFNVIKSMLFEIGYSKIIFSDDKLQKNINVSEYLRGGNYIIKQ